MGIFREAGLTLTHGEKEVHATMRRLGITSRSHRRGGCVVRGYRVLKPTLEGRK